MSTTQIATLGGGCFWCIESAFNQIEGVILAESGYAGGHVDNPSYEQVCDGNTGHVEVVQITFDSNVISYREILEIFFALHDPTQLNRQGNDVGTQYRSVVFYHDEQQQEQAHAIISEMTANAMWPAPIVTAVEPLTNYFAAEAYHQDYFTNNPQNQYCNFVVAPKLAKFKQTFSRRLKSAT